MSEAASRIAGSGDDAPLVTIAMPIYNAGKYLRPAVLSILQQTVRDWELIVIDDGSSDGSPESIRDILDSRLRVLSDGLNRGLAARLNEAIDLARGRYFARMDQDDVSYPERLAQQLAFLERDSELDLVACRCVSIDADSRLVGALPYALAHEKLCARPWAGFYLPHPTWMGRIDWFRRHRYASPGPYGCEDQELLLRSYRQSRFATVPEVLFAYRVRTKIDWGKSVKARRTLLGIQLHHFVAARQMHFGILAALAFIARVGLDSLNFFGNFGILRQSAEKVEASEESRWRSVFARVAR